MCLFITCMRPIHGQDIGHPNKRARCYAYNFHISHNKQVFLAFLYLENSKRTPESKTPGAERYRIDNDDPHEDD
jgi:hypothetical protein